MATPLRVLIVEDSDDDGLLLVAELRLGGYDLAYERVESAPEMRAALDRDAWDVVISDYTLPGFCGVEALRILQESGLDLPLIIVSGNIGEDIAVATMKAGAHDYLIKGNLKRLVPVVERELREAVARHEHRLAERALRESEQQFRQLASTIPEVFWIVDVTTRRHLYIGPAYQRIYGRSVDSLKADPTSWKQVIHPDDRDNVNAALRSAAPGEYEAEYRIVTADGRLRWLHERAFPVADERGRVYRVAGITEDVTRQKELEQRLLSLAHYDSLTGLPNRVLFRDRLKQALTQASRNGWVVAVLFVDLDHFKLVNDTLGHTNGDKLLQEVARRLLDCVRAGDTVSRLGGDEFSLILPDLADPQDAALVAQKAFDAFARPIRIGEREAFVSLSVGITLYPSDSEDLEQLIRNADTAMYRAKEMGRNGYQFYTSEMNARVEERLCIENGLRRALDNEEFLLHYQPKVDLTSGEVTGVEALLRWRRGGGEMMGPAQFIPLLEESGLIVPVGAWVLHQACAQIKAWQDAGLPPVTVAVNLSARQFQFRNLVDSVQEAVKSSGIDPRLLEVEITESALMKNVDEVVGVLRKLRNIGVSISVDDFGTGYSSLGYLQRFPLNAVKVDRSFVAEITSDPDSAAITRAVITLAHSLKLKVVAEGVETKAQMEFLAANHCDEIQGYYFSRPLSPHHCAELLRARRRMPRPQPGDSGAQPTLLLVDDEENILSALRRVLRRDGYRILTASSARAGLDLLAKNPVSVIVSDQRMPEMTGVEFLSRVKALYPDTVRIVLSGYSELQTVTDAINQGAIYKFLSKPWDDEQLRASLREAFRRRELVKENERLNAEIKTAHSRLTHVNEALEALVEEKSMQAQRNEISLNILQESLHHIPLPVVGVDHDGMVALANRQAEGLLGNGVPLLGSLAADTLPSGLTACLSDDTTSSSRAAVHVAGQRYGVWSQSMGAASHARGRLLVLLPQAEAG